MSINDATPDEWDRATQAVNNWLKSRPIPNDRGVRNMETNQIISTQGGGQISPEMTAKFYQGAASRTAKRKEFTYDLLHAALGIASEAGEFTTSVKASVIYGKPLDMDNLNEELGDLLWFVSLACDVLNLELSDVMQANIDKLKKRYPEKYTDSDALARADKD